MKIKQFKYFNSTSFDPFHVKNSNSYIISKGIFLRNALKNPHKKQMKNKSFTSFLKPLGLLFLMCTSDQQKQYKICRGPFNEYSYQVQTRFVRWQVSQKKIKMSKYTGDASAANRQQQRTLSDANTSDDPLGQVV